MTITSTTVPQSYGVLASPPAQSEIISDEERDILQTVKPGYGHRSVFSTSFNIVNATVGSGILGVPYALHCGGFIGGLAISVFVGILTAVSLMMMIRAGIRSNIFKFAQLSERALGRPGFHLLNLFVFIQASGSCISYFIIIGDTIPVLLGQLWPEIPLLANRQFVIVVLSLLLIFPLNLARSIGSLAKVSVFSVLLLPIIILTIVVRAPVYAPKHHAPVTIFGPSVLDALGIQAFAFACTHVAFNNYLSQRNQTVVAWTWTSIISTFSSWTATMLFGILGYLAFGQDVQQNLFNSFPADDLTINIGRLLLAVSLIFTVPMGFYPAREALQKSLGNDTPDRQPSKIQHYTVTIALFAGLLYVGATVQSLGKVYAFVGGLASSFIAYIIPGITYISIFKRSPQLIIEQDETSYLNHTEFKDDNAVPTWWMDITAVVLVVFGIGIMSLTVAKAMWI
ncbi:transmembrane amino acid transporter protein-domain-containing protein [Umbelopsis sp. PMI_123]|nr:transmembrane amino acid transporter protein-domain-containing protein [Umbelopsis sp. PMI_123]